MASTYSTNLKIELMATGENAGTWGNITNTNLGTAIEQALVGYGAVSFPADANLTITLTNSNAAQAARALVLNVTSALSLSTTRELIVPTFQKQYIVQNNTTGGQSITVKTSAGSGITVPNGRKAHLYVDGTNVIHMFDFVDVNGGTIDGVTIGGGTAGAGSFTTLSATGNVTLGDASTDTVQVNGYMGVGGAPSSSTAVAARSTALTSTTQTGVFSNITGTSGATSNILGFYSGLATAAASFTAANVTGFRVDDATKGAGSTITNQYGLLVNDLTQGTNNFGVASVVSSGSNKWNIYANGTANNAFVGNVRIGSITAPTNALDVTGSMTVSGDVTLGDASTDTVRVNGYIGVGNAANSVVSFYIQGTHAGTATALYANRITQTIPATTTGSWFGFANLNSATAASAFTLANAYHYYANDLAAGAGSTITSQHGLFIADLTSATSNYGIVSQVSSGTGKWNIYAGGTANNYFAGNVGIGVITPAHTLDIISDANSFRLARIRNADTGSSAYAGFIVNASGNSWAMRMGSAAANSNALEFPVDALGTPVVRMSLTTAGNLGLGATIPTWNNGGNIILQSTRYLSSVGSAVGVVANGYFDTTDSRWEYASTAAATWYNQSAGQHIWYNAASGTANTAITWTQAMTLDASGNLGLGTTSIGSRLDVQTTAQTIANLASSNADGGYVTVGRTGALSVIGAYKSGSGGGLIINADALYHRSSNGIGFASGGATLTAFLNTSGTLFVGNGETIAAPSNGVISATGGSGTDIAGATLTIRGGASTGSGAGGPIIFSTAAAGVSGTTVRSATERMRIDSLGNLGLGAVPSTWAATSKAIEFTYPVVAMDTTGAAILGFNAYNSSGTTWNYKTTDEASLFTLTNAGAFTWRQAVSGTAGAAITFTQAMTLDASGNLLLGRASRIITETFSSTGYGLFGGATVQGIIGDAGSGIVTLGAYSNHALEIRTNNVERLRVTTAGNVKIGGTADRATTEGTNQLVLFNGTAPVGTLTNGVSFYSATGEARVMDAAGNSTLLSPHDQSTNEWIFHSKHTPTGKVLRIDVERLLRFVNDHFGLDAVQEFIEN